MADMTNSFEPSLCGFQHQFQPVSRSFAPGTPCYWFVYLDNQLLLTKKNDRHWIPLSISPPLDQDLVESSRCIGIYDGKPCMLLTLYDGSTRLENLEPVNLRGAYSIIPEDFWIIAGRGSQIIRWHQDNNYCGRCGSAMFEPDDEMIKRCPDCSYTAYPRISPAVIMSVIKGGEILLGRSPHFPEEMYSTLAGFVEPGESAEEAVKREVMEETGIEVHNIRYIASQAWPFPHSLMLGFTAEYAAGEIAVDHAELEDAGWYSPGDMPRLPSKISIARKLIDIFLTGSSTR